jgi:SAM-dependent methyltransferase
VRSSRDVAPANDHEALLREFDLREVDARDARSVWALRYRQRLGRIGALLQGELAPGARVLEAGSSQANCSLQAAEAGLWACALDRDARSLSYARKKHVRGDFATVCGDLLYLPFADGSFAAVVAAEVLEHLPDPAAALAEVRRVLAPGGLVIVTVPNAGFAHESLPSYSRRPAELTASAAVDAEGHLFAFRLGELVSLLREAGLTVRQAGYLGSVVMSDRNPLKRVLSARAITGLACLTSHLPGAARWSYTCLAVARKPEGGPR